jgi:hypothetical protein
MENETGRIIDFRQQGIFGKGTEYTNTQCKTALSSFCYEDGREALVRELCRQGAIRHDCRNRIDCGGDESLRR